ncbi:MAG: peptide chain release factor aRF-1 [Caldisphaeraceae archaeon]|nr:peptide chain release factor aRF-1 [Caldisphaeraceae archaeon]
MSDLEEKLLIDKKQMRAVLKELKKWNAPATVLLSLYVPPGRPIGDVMKLLRDELSISDNIKLKKTRQSVKRAISAAIDRVSMIQKIPQNGLVAFCGEDMENGDFICYTFSPPEKVPVFYYRTDKKFIVDILEEMIESEDVVGIVIIERDQATIGILKGSRLEVLDEVEDYIPGKHMMGGQSQRRMDRIIEQMVYDFLKRLGERVSSYFLPYLEMGKLKAVIVAGPGYAKEDFVKGSFLDYRIQRLVSKELVDVAYQGEQGLREVVLKARDIVQFAMYRDANEALETFKSHLAKNTGLVVYGEEDVMRALEMGMVSILLLHEDVEGLEGWKEEAEKYGTKVIVLPGTLPEAEWMYKTFGGVAGILRYKIS